MYATVHGEFEYVQSVSNLPYRSYAMKISEMVLSSSTSNKTFKMTTSLGDVVDNDSNKSEC